MSYIKYNLMNSEGHELVNELRLQVEELKREILMNEDYIHDLIKVLNRRGIFWNDELQLWLKPEELIQNPLPYGLEHDNLP
jgi:hypothetical protein